jgi:hypothetical protein
VSVEAAGALRVLCAREILADERVRPGVQKASLSVNALTIYGSRAVFVPANPQIEIGVFIRDALFQTLTKSFTLRVKFLH